MKTKIYLIILISVSNLLCFSQKLEYSTFLGGSNYDGLQWPRHISADTAGNIYFAIQTYSPDFPTTTNAFSRTYQGAGSDFEDKEDIVVVRFNTDQNELVYSTFLGGGVGPEYPVQVLKRKNNMFVVGNTSSSDFPVTLNAWDTSFNGPAVGMHTEGFITGFEEDELTYSTFVGTSGESEAVFKIVENGKNELIAIGTINNCSEIAFTNRFSEEEPGDNSHLGIFIFDSTCTTCLSSSLLGVASYSDVVVDDNDFIYIVGSTNSATYPVTDGACDTSYNGGEDLFLTKLTPDGNQIVFSTFFGGNGWEFSPYITLDDSNNIIITSITGSDDLNCTHDASNTILNGQMDILIAKFSDEGELLYSSYFGGEEDGFYSEFPTGIKTSDEGNIYLFGITNATSYPVTSDVILPDRTGGQDIFITIFDNSLKNILFSTCLGGSSDETGANLTIDTKGNIYGVCGTISTNFPVTPGAYDITHNGGSDIAVFKISVNEMPDNITQTNTTAINIYPNPAHDILQIKYSELRQKEVAYKIIDLTGRTVLQEKLTEDVIDISMLHEGTYLLNLNIEGEMINEKIIIQ